MKLQAIFVLIFLGTVLVGCTQEEVLTVQRICSTNTTYCEDLRRTNWNGTVSEDLTTVLDSRSPDNLTYYENLT